MGCNDSTYFTIAATTSSSYAVPNTPTKYAVACQLSQGTEIVPINDASFPSLCAISLNSIIDILEAYKSSAFANSIYFFSYLWAIMRPFDDCRFGGRR